MIADLLGQLLLAPVRDEAADAARRELARPEYDAAEPGLLTRALTWVLEQLDGLLARVSGLPGGPVGRVLLVTLLGALVAVLLVRLGPLRRQPAAATLFAGAPVHSADDHRAAAEQAAAQERWPDAVRERLRAVVRDLEARGVLDPRPGRTAGEVARDGAAALPALADALRAGTTVFDDVWYGGRPGGREAYDVLVRLDEQARAARPVSR